MLGHKKRELKWGQAEGINKQDIVFAPTRYNLNNVINSVGHHK